MLPILWPRVVAEAVTMGPRTSIPLEATTRPLARPGDQEAPALTATVTRQEVLELPAELFHQQIRTRARFRAQAYSQTNSLSNNNSRQPPKLRLTWQLPPTRLLPSSTCRQATPTSTGVFPVCRLTEPRLQPAHNTLARCR